ncbi:MAG: type III polyketide synthase [bacterium]
MNARISAVATALPPHVLTQSDAKEFARAFFRDDFADIDRLLAAFDNTGIERRHIARPIEWYGEPHTFPEKNAVYRETALELGHDAARCALQAAGVAPGDVGAILFVSTTGIATPSLDGRIALRLGLPTSVARLPIWGLGCAGGAAGLARAAAMTDSLQRPTLLVSVEICSTTFVFGDRSKSNLIATGLFGDGAAAVVLEPDGDGPRVVCGHGHLLPDSEDVMGWELDPEGLRVVFARSIPQIVSEMAAGIVREAEACAELPAGAIRRFVLHPGGTKVLAAYAETLELEEECLRHARAVLRDCGNMSSPSVLFVLERFLQDRPPAGEPALVMGLGPGFAAESVVLHC